MIISHSRKFCFIHIHKTGGSSVETALEPHLAWSDLLLGSTPFGELANAHYMARFGLHKHSSLAEIEAKCGKQYVHRYYVFATVRHPLDRVCSLYNFLGSIAHAWAKSRGIPTDEIAAHVDAQAEIDCPELAWDSTKAFIQSGSFSNFIRDKRLDGDQAFETQVSRLQGVSGDLATTDICKLEEIALWLPRVQHRLEIGFAMPVENQSSARLITPASVIPDDQAYVADRFRRDYIELNYAFPKS